MAGNKTAFGFIAVFDGIAAAAALIVTVVIVEAIIHNTVMLVILYINLKHHYINSMAFSSLMPKASVIRIINLIPGVLSSLKLITQTNLLVPVIVPNNCT